MSKVQGLEQHQKKIWIDFLNHNFAYTSDQSYAIDFAPIVSDANLKNVRIIYENNKIVSSAAMYPRTVLVDHQPVMQIGIVGAVATEEQSRGKGFSKQIVQEIENMAVAQNLDGLVLWSDQKEFYENMGFVEFGKQVIYSLSTLMRPEKKQHALAEGFVEEDWTWSEINKLYLNHPSRINRDERYWAEIAQITSCKKAQWIEKSSGKVLAYLGYDRGKDMQGIIHEWGGDIFALQELVYEITIRAVDQGRDLFWLTSPILKEDPVLELLDQKNVLIEQSLGFFKPLKKTDARLLERSWFWGLDSL